MTAPTQLKTMTLPDGSVREVWQPLPGGEIYYPGLSRKAVETPAGVTAPNPIFGKPPVLVASAPVASVVVPPPAPAGFPTGILVFAIALALALGIGFYTLRTLRAAQ